MVVDALGLSLAMPIPSAFRAHARAPEAGLPVRGVTDRESIGRIADLLADLGSASSWQLAALLTRSHPDRVPYRVVSELVAYLARDRRFVLELLPRPNNRLWSPYWVCSQVTRRPAGRLVPRRWAAASTLLGSESVCLRALVGRIALDCRRGAVEHVRGLARAWQRSSVLDHRALDPALSLVRLRSPTVRVGHQLLFHHLAALETLAALAPLLWPGRAIARVLSDGRLAQREWRDAWAGAKRPDLAIILEDRESAALEFVSAEYRDDDVARLCASADHAWTLVASSRHVAARLVRHGVRGVYYA